MAVGCFGSCLQLVIRLVQQLFGLCGMALHVPLVGLLGGNDLVVGLSGQALGRLVTCDC